MDDEATPKRQRDATLATQKENHKQVQFNPTKLFFSHLLVHFFSLILIYKVTQSGEMLKILNFILDEMCLKSLIMESVHIFSSGSKKAS